MENGENEFLLMLRTAGIALVLVFSGLGLWKWQDLQDHVRYETFDHLRQQHHGR